MLLRIMENTKRYTYYDYCVIESRDVEKVIELYEKYPNRGRYLQYRDPEKKEWKTIEPPQILEIQAAEQFKRKHRRALARLKQQNLKIHLGLMQSPKE